MTNKNLVKVSTYATHIGVSTMAVYKQIERGAIKSKKIDEVTFVVVDDEVYDKIQSRKNN
jgi:hypothetical protein